MNTNLAAAAMRTNGVGDPEPVVDAAADPGLSPPVREFGISVVCYCVIALMAWMVSPPEDYNVRLHGTPSLLPAKIISAGKMASRAFVLASVGVFLFRARGSQRLFRVLRIASPLLLFCAWSIASTAWSSDPRTSFIQSCTFTLLLLMAVVTGCCCRNASDLSRLFQYLTISCVVSGVGLLLLRLGASKYGALTRKSSGILHSTTAGSMASVGMVALIACYLMWGWPWTRRWLIPGVLTFAGVMVAGGNRHSMAIAFLLSFVVCCMYGSRIAVVGFSLLGSTLTALYLTLDSRLTLLRGASSELGDLIRQGQTTRTLQTFSGRSEMWRKMWDSYLEAPIRGHGYFVTSAKGRILVWGEWGNWTAHNNLLQILVTTGLVGASLLLGGLLVLLLRVYARRSVDSRAGTFIALMVTWYLIWGLLNSSFIGPMMPESLYFSVLVGMCLGIVATPPPSSNLMGRSRA